MIQGSWGALVPSPKVLGYWAGMVVLTHGLCLDRYCDQWLPLTLPEEECGNGLCALQVQSARNTAACRGAAEAADGCGQQNALCTHELLHSELKKAQGRALLSGSLPLGGIH